MLRICKFFPAFIKIQDGDDMSAMRKNSNAQIL